MANSVRRARRGAILAVIALAWSTLPAPVAAAVPIPTPPPLPEAQTLPQNASPYDFNAPPQGLFLAITMAEGFDEEFDARRTHNIVAVHPTDRFRSDAPTVFIVFHLHQHYQGFQVFGQLFPDAVAGLDPAVLIGQDAVHVALEDESGYLALSPPQTRWPPGRYRVEIHVGEAVNAMSLIGTMRFTIDDGPP